MEGEADDDGPPKMAGCTVEMELCPKIDLLAPLVCPPPNTDWLELEKIPPDCG